LEESYRRSGFEASIEKAGIRSRRRWKGCREVLMRFRKASAARDGSVGNKSGGTLEEKVSSLNTKASNS